MSAPFVPVRKHGRSLLFAIIVGLVLVASPSRAGMEDLFAVMHVQPVVREVQAPPFRLLTPEGKPISLADFRGRAVALYYWRTW